MVQHAGSDFQFFDLAFVYGAGNSPVPNVYNYIHENAVPGINYYRLKQIDFDGSSVHSTTIACVVSLQKLVYYVDMYSNLRIRTGFSEHTDLVLTIIDNAGKVLIENNISSKETTDEVVVNVSALSQGVYTFILRGANTSLSGRFVVVQ